MRVTTFAPDREAGVVVSCDEPSWHPFTEFAGQPLERVELAELLQTAGSAMQLVHIRAGGSFAMHTGPELAFCQIVHGRGKLGLEGGRELEYQGPELYIFAPGALHDWHGIEEDTLLAVCLVDGSVR